MEILLIVPLVIAISQIFKGWGIESKYIPFIDICLGIVLSFLNPTNPDWQVLVINGLTAGLSAAGLYDLGKEPTVYLGKVTKIIQ